MGATLYIGVRAKSTRFRRAGDGSPDSRVPQGEGDGVVVRLSRAGGVDGEAAGRVQRRRT